jgi:hypothetical protein
MDRQEPESAEALVVVGEATGRRHVCRWDGAIAWRLEGGVRV